MDHTTDFFFAAWNTHRSHQKQTRAHGGKCALTSTTNHPQAAGETASMHEDGSNPSRTLGKGCSGRSSSFNQKLCYVGIESSSACTGSTGQRPLHTSPK